ANIRPGVYTAEEIPSELDPGNSSPKSSTVAARTVAEKKEEGETDDKAAQISKASRSDSKDITRKRKT
ncbi:MAG TPA: hypothetical protein PKM58_05675, partial [Pyrinomonadaceae bacterium]|nr:hypothetical protein [Pyrinomonadaceae bacterium]